MTSVKKKNPHTIKMPYLCKIVTVSDEKQLRSHCVIVGGKKDKGKDMSSRSVNIALGNLGKTFNTSGSSLLYQ